MQHWEWVSSNTLQPLRETLTNQAYYYINNELVMFATLTWESTNHYTSLCTWIQVRPENTTTVKHARAFVSTRRCSSVITPTQHKNLSSGYPKTNTTDQMVFHQDLTHSTIVFGSKTLRGTQPLQLKQAIKYRYKHE